MFGRFREDIRTVFARDPAARSLLEVLLCYPGLHAIWYYRIAHWFWTHKLRLFGRLVSHLARRLTGVEIHPGAQIGRRFFIDHGMGVVIGETSEIHDDVLMYQGVVLGGTSLAKKKRHPTLGNHVVVGAGATLLGAITMGEGTRVGAGSVVIRSVPPHSVVVGVPGRIVKSNGKETDELAHAHLPDPVADIIRALRSEQERLQNRLEKLECNVGIIPPEEPDIVPPSSSDYYHFGEGI